MLSEVKSALRVDSNDHDNEILGLINAAVADLILSGVDTIKAELMADPLVKIAVILYCRVHFDYDDKAADRLLQSYTMLKSHLTMAAGYRQS